MCGRFVRITPVGVLAVKFKTEKVFSNLAPSYNIAPTQEVVIINDEGSKTAYSMQVGIHSLMDKGSLHWLYDDQCQVRDCGQETSIQISI